MAAPKTLTLVEDPLTGKLRFRFRGLTNWLFAMFIFAVWVVLLLPFWFGWIADLAGVAFMCYFMFFILEKRPIKIWCPNCLKVVLSNTPWVCGFRGCKNENADDFPVVHRCEHCGAEPKAYKCHHCGELIFLTEDHLRHNYAYCLNSPAEVKEEEVERSAFETDKRKLEYKLHLTKLDNELRKLEKAGEAQKKLSPEEKIKESWKRRRALTVTAGEVKKQERARNDAEYANDEEMRQWANDALEDWFNSADWERMI